MSSRTKSITDILLDAKLIATIMDAKSLIINATTREVDTRRFKHSVLKIVLDGEEHTISADRVFNTDQSVESRSQEVLAWLQRELVYAAAHCPATCIALCAVQYNRHSFESDSTIVTSPTGVVASFYHHGKAINHRNMTRDVEIALSHHDKIIEKLVNSKISAPNKPFWVKHVVLTLEELEAIKLLASASPVSGNGFMVPAVAPETDGNGIAF